MDVKYHLYSKMKWLESEIERNKKNPGRNPQSNSYYDTLAVIKRAQENGTITNADYEALCELRVRGWANPEYGYYLANIHYNLFTDDFGDKDEVETRIIHFLECSDQFILMVSGWFTLNFLFSFKMYIAKSLSIDGTGLYPSEFIERFGNKKEREILNMSLQIQLNGKISED